MRFDIMTLFPDLVDTVLGESIIGRAQKSGAITVKTHNIRDYSEDKHRRVDDTPYGGGKGMLMMAPPIYRCYEDILRQQDAEGLEDLRRRVIYLSPGGKVLTQKRAEEGIKREIVEVSEALAEKMLAREINAKDHQKLIDSVISEIGGGND